MNITSGAKMKNHSRLPECIELCGLIAGIGGNSTSVAPKGHFYDNLAV
jgi:hypothetical protein